MGAEREGDIEDEAMEILADSIALELVLGPLVVLAVRDTRAQFVELLRPAQFFVVDVRPLFLSGAGSEEDGGGLVMRSTTAPLLSSPAMVSSAIPSETSASAVLIAEAASCSQRAASVKRFWARSTGLSAVASATSLRESGSVRSSSR